jgi:hypothetical protein
LERSLPEAVHADLPVSELNLGARYAGPLPWRRCARFLLLRRFSYYSPTGIALRLGARLARRWLL